MSEAIKSPLTLLYTPSDRECLIICRHGCPLLSAPETGWEHQTQSSDFIGSQWGEDLPTGNARRSVLVSACVCEPSTSALVRHLRHVELVANMHRKGELLWQEAFVDGLPTYQVKWAQAVVMGCKVRQLSMEEVPPGDEGAWGCIEWELRLTHPTEL